MAEHPARKFKAAKPVTQATGATFTENDPAKFKGEGKSRGKTMSNGVEDQSKGATFTCNETHIPTMNADKPAKESKVISDKKAPEFNPFGRKPCDANDEPVCTTPPYPLKKEYRK